MMASVKQAASAEGNSLLETKGELLLKIISAALLGEGGTSGGQSHLNGRKMIEQAAM